MSQPSRLFAFIFSLIILFPTQSQDNLKYQLAIYKASPRVLHVSDANVKALVAKQLYDFNVEYGDQSFDHITYRHTYYALRDLLRDSVSKANPQSGLVVANPKGDSLLNQYFGHRPENEFDRTVAVRSVEFTQEGGSFYSAGGDGKLLKWNFQDRTFEVVYDSHKTDRVVHISPNEQWLALATNEDEIDVFDLSSANSKPTRLRGHRGAVYDMVFFPDNSGFASVGADRKILTSNFKDETEFAQTDARVTNLSLSPNGKSLAAGATNGQIFIYELDKPEEGYFEIERPNSSQYPISDMAFSHDGKYLAIGGNDATTGMGYIQVWDFATNKPFGPAYLWGFESIVNIVKFSDDDRYLAAGSKDKTARVWRFDPDGIYEMPIVLDDHTDWVWDLDFHPDGSSLLTACADGLIRRFPLSLDIMATKLCSLLDRNLSPSEWRQYIGKPEQIPYQETCPGKLIPEN